MDMCSNEVTVYRLFICFYLYKKDVTVDVNKKKSDEKYCHINYNKFIMNSNRI